MPGRSVSVERSAPIFEVKAELFKALAHPARIRILEILSEGGEHAVGEMLPLVGIEASHLSHQLGVLRRAGLVTTRRDGSSVIYSLRDRETVRLLASAKRILINALASNSDLLNDLRAAAGA